MKPDTLTGLHWPEAVVATLAKLPLPELVAMREAGAVKFHEVRGEIVYTPAQIEELLRMRGLP